MEQAQKRKIHRVRISDTVGYALPYQVSEIIKDCRKIFKGLIDFHGHNDLGLATANSLAAIEAGADSINLTINGIGERAGNTSLAESAFILDRHPQFYSNIKLEKIKVLCQYMAKISGKFLAPNSPLVGEFVFTHESGVHCHALQKDPLSYQPFRPEEKGLGNSRLLFGGQSSQSTLTAMLLEAGIKIDTKQSAQLYKICRQKIQKGSGELSTAQVIIIYQTQLCQKENTNAHDL